MRRFLVAGSALLCLTIPPAFAASPQHVASHDFARLSNDGQKAFTMILQAQQALANNQNGRAQSLIDDVSARLQKATTDSKAFVKAEAELHPHPSHAAPKQTVMNGSPVHWLPIGGEYVVTEALAPEKKTALTRANQHLKQGDTKLVDQDLQVIGTDVEYVVALSPLEMTSGAIHRASVFISAGDSKSAAEALQNAMDSVIFVSDNVLVTSLPTAETQHAKHS